jgi:hypothetical protein
MPDLTVLKPGQSRNRRKITGSFFQGFNKGGKSPLTLAADKKIGSLSMSHGKLNVLERCMVAAEDYFCPRDAGTAELNDLSGTVKLETHAADADQLRSEFQEKSFQPGSDIPPDQDQIGYPDVMVAQIRGD